MKPFVHYNGTVENFKNLNNISDYYNKIVFINGGVNGSAIYTHGNYYANLEDFTNAVKSEIQNLNYISTVKVGEDTVANRIIEFTTNDPKTIDLSVTNEGVNIDFNQNFKTEIVSSIDSNYNAIIRESDARNQQIEQIQDAIGEMGNYFDQQINYYGKIALTNKDAITTLIGDDTLTPIRKIVRAEIATQLISENISESFDTLTEMAEWLSDHPNDVTEINNRLISLEELVTETPINTQITNAINQLSVSDSAVSGKYVSAVEQNNGKINVTRNSFPTASSSAIGGVKVKSVSTSNQTIINQTSGNNFPVRLNSDSTAYVTIPQYSNNSGTITGVTAGTGLTGGGTSGNVSLSANGSAIINALEEGTSSAQRNDYIVAQYAGGGTTTTTYHRRKLSNIFSALNADDITNALGYEPIQTKISQTAATANVYHPILFTSNPENTTDPLEDYIYYESNTTNGNGLIYNPSLNTMSLPAGGTITTNVSNTTGNGLTIKTKSIYAPTTSGGTTYGLGTSGQILKTNGSTVYWGADGDTKNTAGSTNTSSKIFLVGATSQAANPQTYSHDTAYVGTDGCLYSNNTKVLTSKVWKGSFSNTASASYDFINLSIESGSNICPNVGDIIEINFTNTATTSTSVYGRINYFKILVSPNSSVATTSTHYIYFYSGENFGNYNFSNISYQKQYHFTTFQTYGGKIFIQIVKKSGTSLYCNIIYNNYVGTISTLTYASIRSDSINVYNTGPDGVQYVYLPLLTRGATGSTSTDGSPHNMYTISNYKYNISENKIYVPGGTVASSDERLKNFKEDVEIDFEKLKNIPKKYFEWKDEPECKDIGTSAQELEKYYPELVKTDDEGYKFVNYSNLSIIALAAIDRLNERITELEEKLKNYEQTA